MSIAFSSVLTAFSVTLLLLSGFYSIGGALHATFGYRRWYSGWLAMFFYLLSGLIAAISVYAIVRSGGMTMLMPVPFLLPFVIRSFSQKLEDGRSEQAQTSKWMPFLFLLIAVVVYLLWYVIKFIPTEEGTISYMSGEHLFYRGIADLLQKTGNENPMKEYLFPERYSVSPYHYGDLWMSALLSALGLSTFLKFIVMETVLKAMVVIGCIAFAQKLLQKQTLGGWKWIALAVGFFSAFAFFFPSFIIQADVYAYALSPKLLIYALCVTSVLFLFDEDKKLPFLCLVFITGLLYVTVLPGLIMAAVLWVYTDYFILSRKRIPNPTLNIVFVAMPVAVYLFVLYMLLSANANTQNTQLANIDKNYDVKDLVTAIKIMIGGSLQFSVYIPLVALVLFDYQYKKKTGQICPLIKPAFFFVIVFMSGIVAWSVMHKVTGEAVQLYHALSIPLGVILGMAIVIYVAAQDERIAVKGLALTIFLASILLNMSTREDVGYMDKKEFNQLTGFIQKYHTKSPLFANLNDSSYLNSSFFAANTVVYPPLEAIAMHVNPYLNFSLNAPYLHLEKGDAVYKFKKAEVDWAPFTYYIQQRQLQHLPQAEAMNRFMTQYKVDFLTVRVDVPIPEKLEINFSDSLSLPKTGWLVYKCVYN